MTTHEKKIVNDSSIQNVLYTGYNNHTTSIALIQQTTNGILPIWIRHLTMYLLIDFWNVGYPK